MKLADNFYTADEHTCPDCGAMLTTVTFYRGREVDHQVFHDENLFTGTKKTTAVTTYVDVVPQAICYCAECKTRQENARRAMIPRLDQKIADKLNRKDKVRNIFYLLLSVILPVGLGFAYSAAERSSRMGHILGTLPSILLWLTIGAAVFGFRLFIISTSRLRFPEDHGKVFIPTINMEDVAIGFMNSRKEDRSIRYFTKAEYQKLQSRGH